MTVSDWAEQPCNKSDNAIKLVTSCQRLVPTTRNKQCEHNLSTRFVNRFVTTCLQTCNNLCVFTCADQAHDSPTLSYGASVTQSSEQASFTSEIMGSILATDSCEKSRSTLYRKSWVLSECSGFLPQCKLAGWWVRMNTVRKVN
jgi:hypothetical protein